jgi:hypothetical protein
VGVPDQPEPVVGDAQEGPLTTNTDTSRSIPFVDPFHVSSSVPNNSCVSLYNVRHNKGRFQHARPFMHMVELKGKRGIIAAVKGLFDDGALVNSICNSVFALLRGRLGNPILSMKTLLMADGTRVPSQGCWIGDVRLGGRTARTQFEYSQAEADGPFYLGNHYYSNSKPSMTTMTIP